MSVMGSPSGFVAPLGSVATEELLEEAPFGLGFSLSLEHELGLELSLAGLGHCNKSSKSESLKHYESFFEVFNSYRIVFLFICFLSQLNYS